MICYEFNDGRYICNSSCALRFPDHHGFIHMDAVQFTPSTCTGHLAMWPGPRPRDPTSKPDLPARPPRSSRRPETARRPDSVSFLSPPSRCGRKERGNDRTSSPRYSFCTHGAIRKSICIWRQSPYPKPTEPEEAGANCVMLTWNQECCILALTSVDRQYEQ
jgi:hypothetical protein